MTDTVKTLHQRLAAAMARVDYVQKEKKAGMRYSIVSHDAVTAKVRPILLDEGVLYYPRALDHHQNGNRTEVRMVIRFVNVDNAEDVIDVPSLGYGIDDQDKGPGKAISYAVKYALLKALGLETGDDPETEQNAVHKPAQRPVETPHDPATGEVRPPLNAAEAATQGLRDAWLDGIRDGLAITDPPSAFYDACAAALIKAFDVKKTAAGVLAQWSKREGIIEEMRQARPEAYENVLDAYNARMRSFEPTPDEFLRAG